MKKGTYQLLCNIAQNKNKKICAKFIKSNFVDLSDLSNKKSGQIILFISTINKFTLKTILQQEIRLEETKLQTQGQLLKTIYF